MTKGSGTDQGQAFGNTERVDVAIIGAGTAGLAALREVRDRTADFVLINAGPYGTTCARVGCMPSKALIAVANAFHARKKFDEFGICGKSRLRANIPAVFRHVRSLRDRFVSGVLKATEDLGPRNITGRARLDGPNRLIDQVGLGARANSYPDDLSGGMQQRAGPLDPCGHAAGTA